MLAPEPFRDARRQYEAELRQAAGNLRVRLVIDDTAGPEGFELAGAHEARAIVVGPSSARDAAAIEATDLEVIQSGAALRVYLDQEPRPSPPSVALIFRQGRDVDTAGELFPDSWNAMVADRNLAALLRIAVLCPPFGRALPLVDPAAPEHLQRPAGRTGGVPFPEARGPAATGPARQLERPGPGAPAGAGASGVASPRHRPRQPAAAPGFLPPPSLPQVTVDRLDGLTTDPSALRNALDRVQPDVVVVVATPIPGRDTAHADAEAVLTVMHVRSLTWRAETPIVGQLFSRLQAIGGSGNPWLTAVYSQDVMAGALAVIVLERESATAAERPLGGADATLEVHRYPPDHQAATAFGAVHDAALPDGTAVLGLATDDQEAVLNPGRDVLVQPGALLLVARQGRDGP